MKIDDFIKTIYLGDQGCKSILINGFESEVKLQITCISRVRSSTWNYYTEEDLPDGYIVFTGVTNLCFEPPGRIPNDEIEFIGAEIVSETRNSYAVSIRIGSGDTEGNLTSVTLRLEAEAMHLEDVKNPNVKITA